MIAQAQLEIISGQSGNRFVRLAPGSQHQQLAHLLRYSQQRSFSGNQVILVVDGQALSGDWQALIRQSNVDEVIGWAFQKEHTVDLPIQAMANAVAARTYFAERSFSNTLFLVYAGSERTYTALLGYLGAPLHQAELRVNLDALRHNVDVHRSALSPGTSVAVMVKANAYGAGLVETARALERAGVEYLAVAYADEGLLLRQAGVRCPVMVLNTEPIAFGHFLQWQLEPVVYSFTVLEALADFLHHHHASMQVHLEFNTGMNRLGFEPAEAGRVGQYLLGRPGIRVVTAFAHLAASGAAAHDAFTTLQMQRFLDAHSELESTLAYPVSKHLLNSGGVARFPQYDMDMVRLGIGVYGADETGVLQPGLQTVMALQARVSQVRTLEAGETIGYSRAGQLAAGAKVATLGIGYADGVPRALSRGRHQVLINGQRAPIVGNVCMDMCMVDVSEVEGAEAGSVATIFGEAPPVEEVAKKLRTIPYEVFTAVGQRVRRVYTETGCGAAGAPGLHGDLISTVKNDKLLNYSLCPPAVILYGKAPPAEIVKGGCFLGCGILLILRRSSQYGNITQ